jgi:hypothetical protein
MRVISIFFARVAIAPIRVCSVANFSWLMWQISISLLEN